MIVRELIDKLSKFDQDLMIIFYREDNNPEVEIYDYVYSDVSKAEIIRDDDNGTPFLKIHSKQATKKVLIELTSDF
jgi:hypothetical protein